MGENNINILVLAKDMASSVMKSIKSNVSDLASEFKGKFTEGVKQANIAIAALAATAGGLLVKSILDASNAQETYSKFATIFKGINAQAQESVEELAAAYGLSSRNARQLVGDTGDLLTGFGFTQKRALDLSLQVNRLAVDLASFTNAQGGAEAVSDALTKALLGEREALKTYGIAIMEADIDAELLRRGMSNLTGETLRQEKAQITLELALRQSKNAIGDFERTSDSFANRMRIAGAQVESFLIELGGIEEDGSLRPGGPLDLATQFINNLSSAFAENKQVIIEFVHGAINSLTSSISELIQKKDAIIGRLKELAVQFGITREMVNKFIKVFTTITPIILGFAVAIGILTSPLFIFIATVTAISAAIAYLWEKFNILSDILAFIQPIIQSVGDFISTLKEQITAVMEDPVVQAFFGMIWDALSNILSSVAGLLGNVWSAILSLYESIKPVVEILAGILVPLLGGAFLVALKVIELAFTQLIAVVNLFISILRGVAAIISGVFQTIAALAEAIWQTIVSIFTDGGKKVGEIWSRFGDKISNIWGGIWDSIKQTGKGAINIFIDMINGAIRSVNGLIEGINKATGVNIGLIGEIPRFAKGGVVGGNSMHGDRILARLNSEEEVVTKSDRQTIKGFIEELWTQGGGGSGKIVNNFHGYDAEQISNIINQQVKLGY